MQAQIKVLIDRLRDRGESTLQLTNKIYLDPRPGPKNPLEVAELKTQNKEYMETIGRAFEVLEQCEYIPPNRIWYRPPAVPYTRVERR